MDVDGVCERFGEPLVTRFGDERALVVVGTGHVHPLRHLLDEAPMTCPVSALECPPA